MARLNTGKFHKTVDLSVSDFSENFDYLYIEGAGKITITDYAGTTASINVPEYFTLGSGGVKIIKAETTATGITAYKCNLTF